MAMQSSCNPPNDMSQPTAARLQTSVSANPLYDAAMLARAKCSRRTRQKQADLQT